MVKHAVAFVLLGVPLLAGCVHPERVEEHWGESQREVWSRMTENPEAEHAPAAGVDGLDPLTGEAVIEKYDDTQRESREPTAHPSIIQIETGGSR